MARTSRSFSSSCSNTIPQRNSKTPSRGVCFKLLRGNNSQEVEQVRKRGLPPLLEEFDERGQAPLPDLFYSIVFLGLNVLETYTAFSSSSAKSWRKLWP